MGQIRVFIIKYQVSPDFLYQNWIIHKLSIAIFNTLLNSSVLNKLYLKIAQYSFHQFSLKLPEFIGI